MNSEKVKEIKKALECCYRGCDCECYRNNNGEDYYECRSGLLFVALELINELESETERLIAEKQKILEYMKTDNYAKLKKEDMYWGYQMGIGMLEHEIDLQKDRIAELEKEIAKNANYLKQFVRRLKEKKTKRLIPVGLDQPAKEVWFIKLSEEEIDETLKEFINEEI